MGAKLHRALQVVLLLVFLISGGLMLRQWVYERGAMQDQQPLSAPDGSVSEEIPEPPEPEIPIEPLEERAEYLYQVDLESLRQASPDVVGWIAIPGTPLDYPFLMGKDNDYYLNRTWQGARSAAGAVFMDVNCPVDFSSFNTILYGHNMKNATMFGSLKKYRTQEYYEQNPCIYIVDDRGLHRYEIFAAFEAEVVRDTFRLDLDTDRKRDAFLNYSASLNVLQTLAEPTHKDSLITLSTCTGKDYDHRWVVQGVLTGTFAMPERPAPEPQPEEPA